ncbi:MAG TPA: hypothetical protein VFK56_21965 [Mycobacterium sp.]|nr:hypothetical protein [Mycobacterium sp.]
MQTLPTKDAAGQAEWVELDAVDDVRVGDVVSPRRITTDGADRLHAAMRSALGDIEAPLDIADICPDPLVFALQAGLPRLTNFAQSIDGGSTWCDRAPIGDGPLYAVSEIARVAERTTSDGRRLVRVDYLTRFTNASGALVGTATGTSIHIGSIE